MGLIELYLYGIFSMKFVTRKVMDGYFNETIRSRLEAAPTLKFPFAELDISPLIIEQSSANQVCGNRLLSNFS
jgi:hypothetical protein